MRICMALSVRTHFKNESKSRCWTHVGFTFVETLSDINPFFGIAYSI